MRRVEVLVIRAFVDAAIGGNPAGVVLDADDLTAQDRQRVATTVGFSETAFLSQSARADYRIDFHTPTRSIDICGHATVATFAHLARIGRIADGRYTLETRAGITAVAIEDGAAYLELRRPEFLPPHQWPGGVSVDDVLSAIGVVREDLIAGHEPTIVHVGEAFVVVPLDVESCVVGAVPDLRRVEAISSALDLVGYYLLSPDTRLPDRDAGARMFAPRYGIPEESATGVGAGAAACYMWRHGLASKTELFIEQGHLMTPPSPSLLHAQVFVDGDDISGIRIGGHALPRRSVEVQLADHERPARAREES